ncbi:MAG TPA: DUF2207 domain-containing protein [Clostridiaceae bacterium]|nr:DUF2207 domain-containing protein [Clostridiaceae bacterium]
MKTMFKVVIIIALSAIFAFGPLNSSCASANNVEYFVSKYVVNINIENDGSAVFEEKITYVFNGSFDGVLRSINTSGTGGIQEQEVYIDKNGNLEQLKQENSGNPGTYYFQMENNLAKFELHEPVKDDIKTFVFKYRLADAITRYIDIAEFNRRIIDQSWEIALNNIVAVISIPQGSSANNISVFAHGPLTVESRVVDDRNVEITVPVISPGDYVEARVLFPPELAPYSTKFKDKYALSEIMETEKKLAAEANIKREEARRLVKEHEEKKRRLESEKELRVKKLQPVGQIIAGIMFLLWFYILLTIYFRYDRKYRHSFKDKNLTEPPGNYTPAEMSTLIWGTLQPRDLIATALDMIRKKCLVINYNNVSSKNTSDEENSNNFIISHNNLIPIEHPGLKAHESFLIDWFLNKIGNGELVTTDEINEYVKDKKNSYQFKSDFEKWKTLVREEAVSLNFFEKSIKRGKYLGLNSGIVYIVAGILISTLLSVFSSIILTVMGIVLLVYSVLLKERSVYGNEQCAKWLAFKKFLKEFSTLERVKIPSIAQWEQYFPYAVSLGVAKDVMKQFSAVYNEQDFSDSNLTYLYGVRYNYLMRFSSILNNTIRTVENIVDTPTNIANSPDLSHFGAGNDL